MAQRGLLLLAFIILATSGCATFKVRGESTRFDREVFPATKQDVRWATTDDIHPVGSALMVFDLPFSLVTDTVMLPFDLYNSDKS